MRPQQPLFLARELYRRRRLMDAARALPLAGAVFFMMPLIWLAPRTPEPGSDGAAQTLASGTGTAGLWLFGLWIVLLVLAGVIAHRLPGAATAAAEAERRAKADAADMPP